MDVQHGRGHDGDDDDDVAHLVRIYKCVCVCRLRRASRSDGRYNIYLVHSANDVGMSMVAAASVCWLVGHRHNATRAGLVDFLLQGNRIYANSRNTQGAREHMASDAHACTHIHARAPARWHLIGKLMFY